MIFRQAPGKRSTFLARNMRNFRLRVSMSSSLKVVWTYSRRHCAWPSTSGIGASSEKSGDSLTEPLSFLFDEAEVFIAAEKEEPVTEVASICATRSTNIPWEFHLRGYSHRTDRALSGVRETGVPPMRRYHNRD